MTYEQAKHRIIRVLPDDFLKNEENRKALSLMGIALEKQIPKKPIMTNWINCPSCNWELTLIKGTRCCPKCGQALDWSDTE